MQTNITAVAAKNWTKSNLNSDYSSVEYADKRYATHIALAITSNATSAIP